MVKKIKIVEVEVLKEALRELVEKAETFKITINDISINNDAFQEEMDSLDHAIDKAKAVLPKREEEKSSEECPFCGMDDEPLEDNGVCHSCNIEIAARSE